MSLKRNTIWNFVGTGLPLLAGFFAIPYLLKALGVEVFGILTLIWALVGYFSLFDFGLGRALTQCIAAHLDTERTDEVPRFAKVGLLFCAAAGLAGALLFAYLAYPLVTEWIKVSPALWATTILALQITAVGIPLTTIVTGLRGISEAYEDFKSVNIIRVILGVSTFGLPVLTVILFGPSLVLIVGALLFARCAALVGYWRLAQRHLPAGWHRHSVSFGHLKRLSSFGVWMTISKIVNPLMITADRFVVAGVLGASVVAFYTVPSEVMVRVLILPAALSSALFPRLASRLSSDSEGAQLLYARCVNIVAAVLGCVCAFTALGSYTGLSFWLGPGFAAESWPIVCVLSVGIWFNGIAHVPCALLEAAGEVKYVAIINLLLLVMYVPLLFALIYSLGIVGAAVAWTFRAAMELIFLFAGTKKIRSGQSKQSAVTCSEQAI